MKQTMHRTRRMYSSMVLLVLCIGSNLGLKFGRERPIRVLLPRLAKQKIHKQMLPATKKDG